MYQSIDQLSQRLSDELPGFRANEDNAVLRAWIWDAMKIIDSDRLFDKADAQLLVVGGKADLPEDFFGIRSYPANCSIRPGQRHLTCRVDGPVTIGYWSIPVDEQGYPLIPEIAETAIIAYVEFKFMALDQKKMYISSGKTYRIDLNADNAREQRANNMLVGVRGEVNMLSPDEMARLILYRQEFSSYHNRF